MATVDSGNETLFSDDSPCDLVCSPSVCSQDDADCHQQISSRPPNIQPHSGVLEKGRVVIRPIAFKPTGMSPAARFGLDGERYGSTPILTRSGRSEHRHHIGLNSNYSLDRKLRSSCQSVSSTPPIGLSSLTSLPHKLANYDSLESVRKSPVSTADSTLTNKSSYRGLVDEGGCGSSLLDLTPSPSDSGVSELEAALRDRDSELAYLRQTMEHNEQVIFRVYQEKERVWERELRRLKTVHETRLRASAQKVMKLEQLLMMQTYQLQQDKRRLSGDAKRANCESDRLRQEVCMLRSRLEETEWNLCQKTGEISLLKTQLKDSQNEHTARGHELLQARNDYRELRDELESKACEMLKLQEVNAEKEAEIESLQCEIRRILQENSATDQRQHEREPIPAIDPLPPDPQEDRLARSDVLIHSCRKEQIERIHQFIFQTNNNEPCSIGCGNNRNSTQVVTKLKEEMESKRRDFDQERLIWAQEKEKVLKYQRQLQMNYIQMYRRNKALEAEVENLAIELELDKASIKQKLSPNKLTQTIEL